ncbi:salutaridine reductase-like [Macadamia integrifolia]|uniref:salutaridine reductase-like n=1 Tax=Macadamia integrifolia TaxID=60698 RepID=UPI001C4F28D8|nr:salutaridine reductase-like [Macadamia integrifolia]XP_042475518.1 salutaridine reductase-like [Macadamia integrifolia]XP_042485342.1 salutaridine reductase-like [Macadamia integrifolia]XP_042485343.1 salutaridine reductase-like [Macadamia integrifolia]XP_042485929.1 salutaridine reductase-like [Macadamia integrifolia]XP_042485930.1 salutaridine reductase-like [Macadamia integrifolia]XP_042486329.1 salutaridine reductase-like [Macadamia integrifolia]XP_042486331.1 salutaridine reductase-l
MAETNTNSTSKRLAVVTGANKGIGLEICRQLASNGVAVVLTARDEKKGVEAVEKLKGSGLSDVVFHQLDVKDPARIASLGHFIKTHFGKLDILVNNAAVSGIKIDDDACEALMTIDASQEVKEAKFRQLARQTYETAQECVQANYYGTKRVTEALLPILQLSDSPRIVNVSSSSGRLQVLVSNLIL